MTALIDLKPVRRCGKCYRLIPADRTRCPYCSGEFEGVPRASHVEQPESAPRQRKPMSPETKKKLKIGGLAVVVIIIGLVIFNFIQGLYRLDKSFES